MQCSLCGAVYVQEIRDTGVAGYQYMEVEDDLAANVLYGNSALIHLASDQIPADVTVSQFTVAHLSALYSTVYLHLCRYVPMVSHEDGIFLRGWTKR